MPDISKLGVEGKKVKVEDKGVVALKGDKGGDFSDFPFKEGTTNVVNIKDIFVQEKGRDAVKKSGEGESRGAARVKGGAKGKKKAASKGKKGKSTEASGEVSKTVQKVMKYTPSKEKKEPTPKKGKVSTKKGGKVRTPALPSPGGKKSTKTTDQMTMD